MPLQELENKQKIEITENLPETKEEPKKRKPEEIENPSLWQRFKDKVINPIRNVVVSLYNRIVLGKNYSNTVAKDYDRARDEGLIDGMFDDGEYTPEDLTSEQLEEEKDALKGFERKDLGDMFDAPPVEQKVAQKDMKSALQENLKKIVETENINDIALECKGSKLGHKILIAKNKETKIIKVIMSKDTLKKEIEISYPYEKEEIQKVDDLYKEFNNEMKRQNAKENKDMGEIPDFLDSKEDVQMDEPVAEIPDFNAPDNASLETDSSSQLAEQDSKYISLPTKDQMIEAQRKMQYEFNNKLNSFINSPTIDNEIINYNEIFLIHQINIQKSPKTDDIEIKIKTKNEFRGSKTEKQFNIPYPYKEEEIEKTKEKYHSFIKDFQDSISFDVNIINKYRESAQEAKKLENKENLTIEDIDSASDILLEAYCLSEYSVYKSEYRPKIPHSFKFKVNDNDVRISYTIPRQEGKEYFSPKIEVNGKAIYEENSYSWSDGPINVGECKSYEEAINYLEKKVFNSIETEKSPATYIALTKGAFDKFREQAQDGDKVLAQTKTKDKSLKDIVFEKKDGQEVITVDEVALSDTKTRNSIDHIIDENKQKEFKTAVITTVETMKTYNEKGDYVVASDTLTAKLSVKEEELTISVETLGGEVKEATIAYPPEKSEVTQTITDLLSQPEQNRTADQPLAVSVADAIIEGKLPDDDSLTDISIEEKTFAEMLEESYANSNFEYKDGEMIEIEEEIEKEQGDDFDL